MYFVKCNILYDILIHRKLDSKCPTYCILYISSVQSYNFFAIFAIVNIHFLNKN